MQPSAKSCAIFEKENDMAKAVGIHEFLEIAESYLQIIRLYICNVELC